MFGQKTRCLAILVVVFLISGSSPAADEAQPRHLSADLKVEIDGPLLSDFPLLFKLTITNTGNAPLYYWCGGPGGYPTATPFVMTATDKHGQIRKIRLSNGQYVQGSGANLEIRDDQNMPAACLPLPAGVYTIQIAASAFFEDNAKKIELRPAMSSKPMTITIVDDPKSVDLANRRILDREKDEPFARHVAECYGIDPIVLSWLGQLLDDDPKVGFKAMGELQHAIRLPPGGGAFFKKAAAKFCHPGTGTDEANLLREISLICSHLQTDDAIDAIVIIANTAVSKQYARKMAVLDLREVPGRRAERALLDLVGDKDSPVYWDALFCLAARHDVIAVKPLLQIATDPNAALQCSAIATLSHFRDLPEVRDALNKALNDASPNVRKSAKSALEDTKLDPAMNNFMW